MPCSARPVLNAPPPPLLLDNVCCCVDCCILLSGVVFMIDDDDDDDDAVDVPKKPLLRNRPNEKSITNSTTLPTAELVRRFLLLLLLPSFCPIKMSTIYRLLFNLETCVCVFLIHIKITSRPESPNDCDN